MKAPKNRRVFVIGYGAATPLGLDFARIWQRMPVDKWVTIAYTIKRQ